MKRPVFRMLAATAVCCAFILTNSFAQRHPLGDSTIAALAPVLMTHYSGTVEGAEAIPPVKWLSLHAQINSQQNAVISWKVEEENIKNYEVQRSTDGINFIPAGTIHSTTHGQNSYAFTDNIIAAPLQFYRILQSSNDGDTSYSDVLKLQGQSSPAVLFSVYPNPVKASANLSVSISVGARIEYSITSLDGQQVYKNDRQFAAGTTVIPLKLQNFAAGIYYVYLKSNTFMLTKKIIKQ